MLGSETRKKWFFIRWSNNFLLFQIIFLDFLSTFFQNFQDKREKNSLSIEILHFAQFVHFFSQHPQKLHFHKLRNFLHWIFFLDHLKAWKAFLIISWITPLKAWFLWTHSGICNFFLSHLVMTSLGWHLRKNIFLSTNNKPRS